MAFIHDQMPIICNTVIHDPFPDEALNDCHVQFARKFSPPASESPNVFGSQIQE